MPTLSRTVTTATPIERVWTFLSDFTSTESWDPNTVRCSRISGDGGVGTVYSNTSKFRNSETTLDYTVTTFDERERFTLRGENKTVVSVDDMTFRTTPEGGTAVTYTAEFTFKGLARLAVPFLGGALNKLGDEAEKGMQQALDAL